jgi:hypothetical protein
VSQQKLLHPTLQNWVKKFKHSIFVCIRGNWLASEEHEYQIYKISSGEVNKNLSFSNRIVLLDEN